MYWVLSIAAVGSFTAMFTLLLFLVYKLRPKTFKVKAAITKWISLEVEMQSPGSTNTSKSSVDAGQQQVVVTAPVIASRDEAVSAA